MVFARNQAWLVPWIAGGPGRIDRIALQVEGGGPAKLSVWRGERQGLALIPLLDFRRWGVGLVRIRGQVAGRISLSQGQQRL
jgi:hypothetical protein